MLACSKGHGQGHIKGFRQYKPPPAREEGVWSKCWVPSAFERPLAGFVRREKQMMEGGGKKWKARKKARWTTR